MVCLNVGGGNFHQKQWLNLDYPFEAQARKRNFDYIDIAHNLMECKPFPLDNESVDVAYTEHCIEHLTMDAATAMLQEVYRVIKPGSVFRVACPDADIPYNNYVNRKTEEKLQFNKRLAKDSRETAFLDIVATPLIGKITDKDFEAIMTSLPKEQALDKLTELLGEISQEEQAKTPGGHLSWWNYDKLKRYLTGSGFRKVRRRSRKDSACEQLRMDYIDRTAPKYSIYVECGK